MVSISSRDYQFAAILGDLDHKKDVYLLVGTFGPRAEAFFTNQAQADFLRSHFKELVPPNNPNGTPPSDHTVGTAFEFYYATRQSFRVHYTFWLRQVLDDLSE
jgi:hypothetical protein